jgi:hypothetical protein
VGPRAGLDDVEKRKFLSLPALELRLLRRPARNQSLYQLRYPGSRTSFNTQCIEECFKYKLQTLAKTALSATCLFDEPFTFEKY